MELIDIGYEYYRFGSADSIDIDILINHPSSTGLENDSHLLKIIKEQNSKVKEWNANIIAIENGVVSKSIPSKGSPDGVNNSLYETYHLHKQKFPFPLERKLERDIDAAIEKCLMAIFTFYKRTNQDAFYKSIPKGIKNGEVSMKFRLDKLNEFDFNLLPYDDDTKNRNALKSIAFHVGQTISLLQGTEIYTKADLVYLHPELISIIKRENTGSIEPLNKKKDELKKIILNHYGIN